jgi:hypothetical protein
VSDLYAWVNLAADGQESIIAVQLPGIGENVPLVFARPALAQAMRPFVEEHVANYGFNARLVKYRAEEVIETVRFQK